MTGRATRCGRANLAWDAAHRVRGHETKCKTLHGHRYSATVVAEAMDLDDVGRVVDFGAIKAKVGTWIDHHWDHTTLVGPDDDELFEWASAQAVEHDHRVPYRLPGPPTAEVIAAYLFDVATHFLADDRIRVVSVVVYETPNCFAEVEVEST